MTDHARLLAPQGPYFHLLEAEADTLGTLPGASVHHVDGATATDEKGLMRAFSAAMDFPGYFGGTWDSLDECLTDLEWLPSRHVVVVLRNAASLLSQATDDLEILAEILWTTAEAWGEASDEATPMSFHVVLQDQPGTLSRWIKELQAQGAIFDQL